MMDTYKIKVLFEFEKRTQRWIAIYWDDWGNDKINRAVGYGFTPNAAFENLRYSADLFQEEKK